MKVFLTTLALLLISTTVFSQLITVKERPSFFLGKRISVDVNLNSQLAFEPQKPVEEIDFFPSRRYRIAEQLYFHYNPELNIGFALTNKVGLYAKFGVSKRSRKEGSSYMFYQYGNNSWDNIGLRDYGNPVMKGTKLGGGFSFFFNRKAALAPMGTHFNIGASMYNYNITHQNMFFAEDFDYNSRPTYIVHVSDIEMNIKHYAIDLEYIMREPITKLLYYQFGLSSTINIGARQLINSNQITTAEEALEANNRNSFKLKDVAILKLGLGAVL